jgi:hypothetical protein
MGSSFSGGSLLFSVYFLKVVNLMCLVSEKIEVGVLDFAFLWFIGLFLA